MGGREMGTIFWHRLVRLRGGILGFGLALFVLGWPLLAAYEVVRREQERLAGFVRNFAGIITALGGNVNNLGDAASYLSMRYFSYLPLVLGVYAVLAGSGLLASDEENGTLDLILAHPVSRTALFVGRWLAFTVALLLILVFAWLGLLLPVWGGAFPLGGGTLLLPFVSLLAVLLFYGNLALLLSMVLPSRRLAAATAGMLLGASFFLTMLARVDPGLETVALLSPLQYYQSGEAVKGLNFGGLAGLLAAAGLWAVLAWWRFERRDIRVAGEGVWRWPFRRRRAAA
jgi:ABC-2 type transport system permease protein